MRDHIEVWLKVRIMPFVAVLAVYLADRFAITIDTELVALGAVAVIMVLYDWLKWAFLNVIKPRISG